MHRIWIGMIACTMPAIAAVGQEAEPAPIARAQFVVIMDNEFHKIDTDKNGELTTSEIDQFQKSKAVAAAEARNKALFAQLDTNKNGSLSPAEFGKLVTPPTASNSQALLTRMDGNRDSQVSLGEYRAAALANFDRLDTDQNGSVSQAEMKAGGVTPP